MSLFKLVEMKYEIMKTDNSKREVEIAFARLIRPLATVTALEAYKDYKKLLSIILKWSADYMITRKLSLIHHDELLDVYNKLENLKTKWLFDSKLGEESELRKLEIEKNEKK